MIADSFISNKNKLLEMTGNGQSKYRTYQNNIDHLSNFLNMININIDPKKELRHLMPL